MSADFNPKGHEDQDKKKASSAAPWMPASANAAKRGKWGTMFTKSGPVGRFLATKAGAVALAVGVVAVAAVAGVVLSKMQPAAPDKSGSLFAAKSAARKYYTPSGARRSNQSSLSLIVGSKDYRNEVSNAIVEPEAAVEESAAAAPEMPQLPSAVPVKAKFSASGASASTGGGSSASVVAPTGGKAKKEETKAPVLADLFNNAKAGAGMRSTGMNRTPTRAAGGTSGKRQANAAPKGAGYVAPSGADSIGKLEAMKAAADAKFKEGNSPVGTLTGTGAAAAPNLADTSSAEMPEAPSDTASSPAGGGGPGGGSGTPGVSCEDEATKLKDAAHQLMSSTKEFADLAAGAGGDNPYDALCNVDDQGAVGSAITNMVGSMNQMNDSLKKLAEGACVADQELPGWECGVLCRAQKEALPAVSVAEKMCQNYYTRRKIDIQRQGKAAENMRHIIEDKDYNWNGIHRAHELSLNKYDQIKAQEKTDLPAGKDSEEFKALKDFNKALNGDDGASNDTAAIDKRLQEMTKTGGDECVYETQDIEFSLKDQRGTCEEIKVHNRSVCEQVVRVNCESTYAMINNTLDDFSSGCGRDQAWDENAIQDAIDACMANHGDDCSTLNENIKSIVLKTNGNSSSITTSTATAAATDETSILNAGLGEYGRYAEAERVAQAAVNSCSLNCSQQQAELTAAQQRLDSYMMVQSDPISYFEVQQVLATCNSGSCTASQTAVNKAFEGGIAQSQFMADYWKRYDAAFQRQQAQIAEMNGY